MLLYHIMSILKFERCTFLPAEIVRKFRSVILICSVLLKRQLSVCSYLLYVRRTTCMLYNSVSSFFKKIKKMSSIKIIIIKCTQYVLYSIQSMCTGTLFTLYTGYCCVLSSHSKHRVQVLRCVVNTPKRKQRRVQQSIYCMISYTVRSLLGYDMVPTEDGVFLCVCSTSNSGQLQSTTSTDILLYFCVVHPKADADPVAR